MDQHFAKVFNLDESLTDMSRPTRAVRTAALRGQTRVLGRTTCRSDSTTIGPARRCVQHQHRADSGPGHRGNRFDTLKVDAAPPS